MAERRTLFRAFRAAGHSVLASSRMSGINRSTGARWDAEERRKAAEIELAHPEHKTQRAAIASKIEVAERLTAALHQVKPEDVPAVASELNKTMGYHAAVKTESLTVVLQPSVQDWIEADRRRRNAELADEAAAQPQLGPTPDKP